MLRKLVGHYVDGKYTGGKVPTLREMFAVYGPASDRNDPEGCAQFVARGLAISAATPVDKLISA